MSGKADSEIKVKFTTEHDGAGADAANRKLDETKKKAGEAAGGFTGLGNSIALVKGVMEKVNAVFMGLGIIGVVSTVINYVKTLHDWINESKERAKELAEEARKAAESKSVDTLSEQYKALAENIKLAKEAVEDMRELDDINRANVRALEDAKSALDEENEIGGVKPDDPDKALKEDAIRKRYARQRALTDLARKREDLNLSQLALREDAAMSDAAADKKEASLPADDELIERTRRQLAEQLKLAKAKKRSWLKYLAGGEGNDWVDDVKTQDKARGEIPALEERLKKLEADRAVKAGEIEADRRKAASTWSRSVAQSGGFKVLNVQEKLEDKSGTRASADAQAAIDKAAADRDRDARDLEQARRDKASADARKAELESRLGGAKGAAEEESQEAWRARMALDANTANRPSGGGDRKWADAQRALQAAWEREQTEAAAAAKALEALGEATAKNLQALSAKASAAAAKVKALEAKLNRDPYGDGGAGD